MSTWTQAKPQPRSAAMWLQRALAWMHGGVAPAGRAMRHVETLSLGQKRAIHLVECNGQRFLVAAGDLSAPVALTQQYAMQREEQR